jgi:hypothetical protein
MDSKEVRSSESCGARKVKGSRRGGVGIWRKFGGSVESLGVRGVMLLPLAVVLWFRNCKGTLRPQRRHFSASDAIRDKYRFCISRRQGTGKEKRIRNKTSSIILRELTVLAPSRYLGEPHLKILENTTHDARNTEERTRKKCKDRVMCTTRIGFGGRTHVFC